MKLLSFFSALIAVSAFALSLVFSQHATAFYFIAVSAAVVLIAARDYAPRARRWQPRLVATHDRKTARPKQNLQLAA